MCAFILQEGKSLMWLACNSGQTNIVTVLLDSGADVNLQNVSTSSSVMNQSLKFFLHYAISSQCS